MNGDTIIDSVDYKKVYLYAGQDFDNKQYYTAIRSDTNKKVYVYFDREYLLYDFDFVEGKKVLIDLPDSILHPFYPYDPFSPYDSSVAVFEFVEVDSVFIFGKMRKRAWVVNPYIERGSLTYWIEGVGSSQGLFYNNLFYGKTNTLAFTKRLEEFSDTMVEYVCADYLTSIIELDEVEFQIAPNPTGTFTKISLEAPLASAASIRIFNNQGVLIQEEEIEAGSSQLELSFSSQSQGLYLIQLFHEGKIIGEDRIIKTH